VDLGERIRRQRMKSGLKSMELAEKSGLSPGFISQMERNLVNPSISTLKKIADALDVPVGSFFEEVTSEKKKEGSSHTRSPVVHEKPNLFLSGQILLPGSKK